MALLLDTINVPMAKASIIWLIGEYCDRVPKLAPDVLRKAAKSFIGEKDIVKLQTINLAAKLFITNPKQSKLLTQYVLNLAKYDMNYDIRDRGRFVRALLFPQAQDNNKDDSQNTTVSASFLSKRIKKIFLATKPAPLLHSNYKDRHQYQLGTLSHILNQRVNGYNDLPDWPEVAPDPSLRVVKEIDESPYNTGNLLVIPSNVNKKNKHSNEESDSSSESSESSSEESKDSSADSEEKNDTETEDSSESSSDSEDEETDDDIPAQISTSKKVSVDKLNDENAKEKIKVQNKPEAIKKGSYDDSSNSESSSNASESDASSDDKPPIVTSKKKKTVKPVESKPTKAKAPEIDLLLDFDEPISDSVMTSNFSKAATISAMPLTPSFMDKIISAESSVTTAKSIYDDFYIPTNIPIKTIELLSKFNSRLVSIDCQFTRSLSVLMNNPKYISVNLLITNICRETLHNVRILRDLSSSNIDSSSQIDTLLPSKTLGLLLAIDFKDCSQPVMLTVGFYTLIESNATDPTDSAPRTREQEKQVELKIKAPIGELFQPINMTEKEFLQYQSKLKGMNEFTNSFPLVSSTLTAKDFIKLISQAVYSVSNITTVSNNRDDSSIILRYAGCSCSSQLPCLIEITVKFNTNIGGDSVCNVKVNSEQITLVSQLLKEFTDAIKLTVNV